MKHQISKLLQHPYIKGSSINFIGSLGVNFLSYIFNLIIGRMLGPSLYSEYFSLISIWYLAAMPSSVLQTVITKQIAHYSALNDQSGIRSTIKIGFRYATYWGSFISLSLAILSPLILTSLKSQNYPAFFLIITILFISYLSIPLQAFFVGKQQFITFSLLSGLGIFGRILLVIPFVLIDKSVTSIALAMLISSLFPVPIIIYLIHRQLTAPQPIYSRIKNLLLSILQKAKIATDIHKEILRTLQTSFIATLGLAALTQVDVLLARARLTSEAAGIYSSLAVTGKVIPFFTLPLVGVLLPQVTAKIARHESIRSTILIATTFVGLGSASIAIIYSLFPSLVIQVFLGTQYLDSAPYLGSFALFQSLFALTTLGVMTSIAMNNFKSASIVILTALAQLIGIFILPPTIFNIILISTIATLLTVIYYAYILLIRTNRL